MATEKKITYTEYCNRIKILRDVLEKQLQTAQMLIKQSEQYYKEWSKLDPEIVEMLRNIDNAVVEPLTKLIRYIDEKVEA